MAGDWLKIEKITPEKPEIVRMAAILKKDSDEIFGKLFKIWRWADDQSINGSGMKITGDFIDRMAGKKGFAKAMREVGWLEGHDGSLTFPGFARHNGDTAKARAETNRRVTEFRQRNGGTVTGVTPEPLQKPLPEKRREESNTPLPPCRGDESERVLILIGKIKSLRKRWAASPHLTAAEARVFRKNLRILDGFTEEDWTVQREFLAAKLADGSALFQPQELRIYLRDPGGTLGHARSWKDNRRPRLSVVPAPLPTDEPPATAEDVAETFARFIKP